MNDIAIFGSGLVGMFVGIHLMNEAKVHFVGRSSTWKDKLSRNQWTSVTNIGINNQRSRLDQNAYTSIDELLSVVDVHTIVFTLKRVALNVALTQLHESLKKKLTIITLMNGVGSSKQILEFFESNPINCEFDIIEGIWSTNIIEIPNENEILYHQGTTGDCYLQETTSGLMMADLFNKCGLPTQTSPDIPLQQELNDFQYRSILGNCMMEALMVYEKANIDPVSLTVVSPSMMASLLLNTPNFLFHTLSSFIIKVDENATSSMYEDLKHKRQTEIDYLQGEVIRLATIYDVNVPYCKAVFDSVKHFENLKLGIIKLTSEEILKDRI
ncbi:ketopantoate reductase PanE/ApbA C terminal-domain-containing protein [Globomyces pollinis-pini]|nr:ketopantoate reductase PanE/ApbA C terminal-domain-containing protein [Globomyces pollinis-pini]